MNCFQWRNLSLIIIFLNYCHGKNGNQVLLSELYPSKQDSGVSLFPLHDSTIYPTFVRMEGPVTGRSVVQLLLRDVPSALNDLNRQGFLVTSVCSYRYLNETYFVVNSDRLAGVHHVIFDVDMKHLEDTTNQYTEKRIKPHHICVSEDGRRFSAVWHEVNDFLWHFVIQEGPLHAILLSDIANGKEGYYPDTLQVYRRDENDLRALAIWRKGYGVRYRVHEARSVSELIGAQNENSNFAIKSLSAVSGKKGRIYAVLLSPHFTWKQRDVPRNSRGAFSLPAIDWAIEEKMRQLDIPSISICVHKDGLPVHQVAYGYADLRSREMAHPLHSYRIASVSKTITAMAIQRLVNDRILRLQDNVFGPGSILGFDLSTVPPNFFMRLITIQNLLEHTSGAWDHIYKLEFAKKSVTNQTEYLKWLFAEHQPFTYPGGAYRYSNIGYVILGRVIEKVTKTSYADFVKHFIFEQLDIDARIGGKERMLNEVSYYSFDNANPYFNWDPIRLDSAAGWVMNAEEVAKLFGHIDKFRGSYYSMMATRSMRNFNYGRGIQLGSDGSLYHIGSLAGTESIGFSKGRIQCGILTNVRGKQANMLTGWMLQLCGQAADLLQYDNG